MAKFDPSWAKHGKELVDGLRKSVDAHLKLEELSGRHQDLPNAYLCGADVPGLVAYVDSLLEKREEKVAPAAAMADALAPSKPSMTCLAWGELKPGAIKHPDCPVVLREPAQAVVPVTVLLPAVCACDCLTCKRAWESDGRPSQAAPGGAIIRRSSWERRP